MAKIWNFPQYLLLPSMHILSRLKFASSVAILFSISIIKTKIFWCLNWPGNFQKPSKFLRLASKCAAYIHHSLGDKPCRKMSLEDFLYITVSNFTYLAFLFFSLMNLFKSTSNYLNISLEKKKTIHWTLWLFLKYTE